jgi:hypothetical protein
MTEHEQLQLDLEYAGPPDHYTIEVRCGRLFSEETIRSMEAKTPEDAVLAIESLRETYAQRDNVTWAAEEVNSVGDLLGVDDLQNTWQIHVNPPLPVS